MLPATLPVVRSLRSVAWLVLLSVSSPVWGLVIDNSGTEMLFSHMTGDFGPQTYNVTGPLSLANPTNGCTRPQLETEFQGRIVMAVRGDCPFVQKALNAQLGGAVGVIVGNNVNSDPALVKMASTPGDGSRNVSIPAVFVSRSTYLRLYEILSRGDPLTATLDTRGEVIWVFDTTWQAILLPFLGVVGAVFLLWTMCKWCQSRRRRVERVDISRHLPLIHYTAADIESNGRRIHNETCVICLSEFENGDPVKVLPCNHGFHQECIDPWLNERSELCPICKQSILDVPFQRRCCMMCGCCSCCREEDGVREALLQDRA